MHVRRLLIGTIALLGITAAIFWGVSKNESKVAQQPEQTTTSTTTPEEQGTPVPEYLYFESVGQAGVSLAVENSNATEYLRDDTDNDLEEEIEEKTSQKNTDEDTESDEDEEEQEREEKAAQEKAAIEGSLEPGVYVTPFGTENCEYELWRVMEDGQERTIGQDQLGSGRLIANINGIEPDRFWSSASCGEWALWSPIEEPLTTAGNGDYWFTDLQTGTWSIPSGCKWERVSDFRGAQLQDVMESGAGPTEIGIGEETLGLRLRSCSQNIEHISEKIKSDLVYTDKEAPAYSSEISTPQTQTRRSSRR